MKLSEAIRLGSMIHPQAFNQSFRLEGGEIVATCALGAATMAAGRSVVEFARSRAHCPVECSSFETELRSVIAHLNDAHRWTRERIADWVETIEQMTEASVETSSDKRCESLSGGALNGLSHQPATAAFACSSNEEEVTDHV